MNKYIHTHTYIYVHKLVNETIMHLRINTDLRIQIQILSVQVESLF